MVFQPGISGNPNGSKGRARQRRNAEVFDEIKRLEYLDPLITLARIQHESENEGIRASAAAALAPYTHPKLQSLPVPRFNPTPIDIPEFQAIPDAERFLAKIAQLTARGELDFQSALELTTIAKTWIDCRSTSEIEQRLTIVEQAMDFAPQNGTKAPAVIGGLPRLPGCNIVFPGQQGSSEPPADSEDPSP
jgi:hypothetical protein